MAGSQELGDRLLLVFGMKTGCKPYGVKHTHRLHRVYNWFGSNPQQIDSLSRIAVS
ncbi:MAG: hypothetical protein QNJ74_16550 [Trichodesmium sp. MO_231.B1]|nr:hypothetical protein [Trichodesmium sp. MO_231.B1]